MVYSINKSDGGRANDNEIHVFVVVTLSYSYYDIYVPHINSTRQTYIYSVVRYDHLAVSVGS